MIDEATKRRIRTEAHEFAERLSAKLCEALADAKPVPIFCRGWARCTSLAKQESQPCCGCANYEPDLPVPWDNEAVAYCEYWRESEHKLATANADLESANVQLQDCDTEIERLKASIDDMTNAKNIYRADSQKWANTAIVRNQEITRLKDIIEHNNREYSAVLAQLRAENFRLTDPSRDLKVNRLISDLREVVVAQRDRLARICEAARPGLMVALSTPPTTPSVTRTNG
jgi:hypothetical protein